jgi:hypothetical protein
LLSAINTVKANKPKEEFIQIIKLLFYQLLRSWQNSQPKDSIILSLSAYAYSEAEAAMIIAASKVKGN